MAKEQAKPNIGVAKAKSCFQENHADNQCIGNKVIPKLSLS